MNKSVKCSKHVNTSKIVVTNIPQSENATRLLRFPPPKVPGVLFKHVFGYMPEIRSVVNTRFVNAPRSISKVVANKWLIRTTEPCWKNQHRPARKYNIMLCFGAGLCCFFPAGKLLNYIKCHYAKQGDSSSLLSRWRISVANYYILA